MFLNQWHPNTPGISRSRKNFTYEIYQEEERKIINIKKRKQDNDVPLQNKRQKYLDKKV